MDRDRIDLENQYRHDLGEPEPVPGACRLCGRPADYSEVACKECHRQLGHLLPYSPSEEEDPEDNRRSDDR